MYRTTRFKTIPRILDTYEFGQMMQHMGLLHKAFFGLLFFCGLRVGELVRLQMQDVNVHAEKILVNTLKSDTQRIVPLPKPYLCILREYLSVFEPEVYLFEKKPGINYDIKQWNKNIKVYAQKAGLYNWQKLKTHSLRHSYACHLYENGVPIETVSSLLGHAHLEHTMAYVHVAHKTKKNLVNDAFDEQKEELVTDRELLLKIVKKLEVLEKDESQSSVH